MIPTPTHLVEFTEPIRQDEKTDTMQYVAKVKCKCGNDSFELFHAGDTNQYGPCVTEFDGHYFFIIKVNCIKCGQKYLLFDADFHGWNGWICHNEVQASLPRPQLKKWECKNCSSSKHQVTVIINSQGEEDFLEEAGKDFDKTRWQDAFDWFSLDIKCLECGTTTSDFASYETM